MTQIMLRLDFFFLYLNSFGFSSSCNAFRAHGRLGSERFHCAEREGLWICCEVTICFFNAPIRYGSTAVCFLNEHRSGVPGSLLPSKNACMGGLISRVE